jgi:hypothetical protein
VAQPLVRAAEARLQRATLLLQAARSAKAGGEFAVEGSQYRRTGRDGSHWRPTALFLAPIGAPGPRFDAECEENNVFWTWAGIEVLRRTGARIEELLELTHLSCVSPRRRLGRRWDQSRCASREAGCPLLREVQRSLRTDRPWTEPPDSPGVGGVTTYCLREPIPFSFVPALLVGHLACVTGWF